MNQKSLSKWLKFIMIGVGLCGACVYFLMVPGYGRELADANPEFAYCYVPWLIFLWGSAIPCYGVLVKGWRIATRIGEDRSFSRENARDMKHISIMAAVDSIYFFLGNLIFMFLGMNHPAILIVSLLIIFAGFAVTIAAAGLSHLILNAAELQEENDLTV